jgi:hypothetical protein
MSILYQNAGALTSELEKYSYAEEEILLEVIFYPHG